MIEEGRIEEGPSAAKAPIVANRPNEANPAASGANGAVSGGPEIEGEMIAEAAIEAPVEATRAVNAVGHRIAEGLIAEDEASDVTGIEVRGVSEKRRRSRRHPNRRHPSTRRNRYRKFRRRTLRCLRLRCLNPRGPNLRRPQLRRRKR